jgi:ATP-dependent protease Clp ATPase subunit
MTIERVGGDLCCDFCGKPRDQVKQLIAGHRLAPEGRLARVGICDECISLCMSVMARKDRVWFDEQVEKAKQPGQGA